MSWDSELRHTEMELTQSAEPGEQFSAPEQTRSCVPHVPTDCSPREGCLTPPHPRGAADTAQDLQQPQNFLLQLAARQLPEDAGRAVGTRVLDLVCSYLLQVLSSPGLGHRLLLPGAGVVAQHRSSPSHPEAAPAAPSRTSLPLRSGGREGGGRREGNSSLG